MFPTSAFKLEDPRLRNNNATLGFASKLEELTVNSKPIIEELTTIAKASRQQAQGIIDILEKRVSTVSD